MNFFRTASVSEPFRSGTGTNEDFWLSADGFLQKKNDIIFSTGSTVSEIGIVLSGSVNVENIDFWGNKSILGNMNEGHIFAETYALCREPMMVDAVAASNCEILF